MTERKDNFWLEADWPAPNNIKAGTSTRISGYSRDPYNESNLSFNVVTKGQRANMCKVGNKRRRTKAQIKEDKRQAVHKENEQKNA